MTRDCRQGCQRAETIAVLIPHIPNTCVVQFGTPFDPSRIAGRFEAIENLRREASNLDAVSELPSHEPGATAGHPLE
jgi:hypothetical protein